MDSIIILQQHVLSSEVIPGGKLESQCTWIMSVLLLLWWDTICADTATMRYCVDIAVMRYCLCWCCYDKILSMLPMLW